MNACAPRRERPAADSRRKLEFTQRNLLAGRNAQRLLLGEALRDQGLEEAPFEFREGNGHSGLVEDMPFPNMLGIGHDKINAVEVDHREVLQLHDYLKRLAWRFPFE